MPSHDRRAAGRRRAWGRGPIILKLESPRTAGTAGRTASANSTLPDLVNSSLITVDVRRRLGQHASRSRAGSRTREGARPQRPSRSRSMPRPSGGSTSIPCRSAR